MPTVHTEHIYVEKKPGVCGGEPVITGTRIPVRILFQRISSGDTTEDIHHSYPHLTLAQIHDALSYCYDHIDEINKYIQEEEAAYCQKKQ
ncbi:MAG: DUF433 domain-containing protein [Nitrospirota bacterium]